MKITYIHQYFKTQAMSGGTRSYEMAKRLVRMGHEVHVVASCSDKTFSGWFYENLDGIHIHWVSIPYSNKMSFSKRILAFLRFAGRSTFKACSIKADVVFATSTPLTIGIPGLLSSWYRKIPMVFEIRDIWPDVPIHLGVIKNNLLKKLLYKFEKLIYQRSSEIVVLAPGMAEAVTKFKINKSISIIPNGCDLDFFQQDMKKKFSEERSNEEFFTIVYIGTIGHVNGVDYIVHLAERVLKKYHERKVKFNIIGDGARFNAVKTFAKERGVLDNNFFMLGPLAKAEIPSILNQSDVSIMTYTGPQILYRDSVSNKFFDSLASGVPIISNFSGFAPQIAVSYGAGLVLPESDYDKAADELIAFIYDTERYNKAAASAVNLAKTYFDRDRLAESLEAVLLKSLNASTTEDFNIGQEYKILWENAKSKVTCKLDA